jgi:hypothetical protein
MSTSDGFNRKKSQGSSVRVETIELDPESIARLRRGTMARFCQSLTPEDWLQLEALPERLRNGLLVLAVQELLKRRTAKPLGRMVGKQRASWRVSGDVSAPRFRR